MIVIYLVAGLAASALGYVSCVDDGNYYVEGMSWGGKNKNKKDRPRESDLIKDMQAQTGINVNLRDLYQMTEKNVPVKDDIEEDEEDRFITKRNGSLRSKIFGARRDNRWAEDLSYSPVRRVSEALIRKRRCGGGGGGDDDDDGDADRSRRSRRIRKVRKKVKKNKKSKSSTGAAGGTVKTIKVIQNGQVVSQSVQYEPTATATTLHHQLPLVQPTTVQFQHPALQHQQVIAQPQLIQTAAPGVLVQQPPVVQLQPAQPAAYIQQ